MRYTRIRKTAVQQILYDFKEDKDAKRAKQLEERLKGCTEHQRKKVLSKLKEIKRKNVRK